MIYLDNAATTPLTPSVIDAMTEIMVNDFGNPSSIHGIGRHANQRLRSYRQTIASALKTDPRRIIFTSGATPTVLTLPSTVKMPTWWAGIETNTTYEMCITDGVYCGVMSWAT